MHSTHIPHIRQSIANMCSALHTCGSAAALSSCHIVSLYRQHVYIKVAAVAWHGVAWHGVWCGIQHRPCWPAGSTEVRTCICMAIESSQLARSCSGTSGGGPAASMAVRGPTPVMPQSTWYLRCHHDDVMPLTLQMDHVSARWIST